MIGERTACSRRDGPAARAITKYSPASSSPSLLFAGKRERESKARVYTHIYDASRRVCCGLWRISSSKQASERSIAAPLLYTHRVLARRRALHVYIYICMKAREKSADKTAASSSIVAIATDRYRHKWLRSKLLHRKP